MNDNTTFMPAIALVQLKTSTSKNKNLDEILKYIKIAANKNTEICVFPEFMMFYNTSSQLSKLAEKIDGEFVSNIANEAKKNSINIIGTFYEKSKNKNKVYDTAFFINKLGKIISTYRKTHLFDAFSFRESDNIMPGTKIMKPINTDIGKLGMLICYDLRFPEVSRVLTIRGSEILVVPSAWIKGYMKEQHWLTINKTRAIENGCYIIAPNQVGNIYCGRSIVVDPFGKIVLDMKKREGIGIIDIHAEKIKNTRMILPLLKHRRPDIY